MIELLQQIGLSQGEATVYHALFNNPQSTVTKLSKATKIHRTTIYEYLEKLENKGLVNHVNVQNVKQFSINDTGKITDYIEEKKDIADEIIELVKSKKPQNTTEPIVEIHKGKEGIKFLLNDIIRNESNYVFVGINEEDWEDKFSSETKRHFKKETTFGIKSRGIISDNQTAGYELSNYKTVPKEYFTDSPIITYGDSVANIIWEPLTIIIIRNKQLAEANKGHFELLWKIGKRPEKFKKI